MHGLKAVKAAIECKDAVALIKSLSKVNDRECLAPLLTSILLDEWHEMHEEIVFELGLIGDPVATNAIEDVAPVKFEYLVKWNNLHEFQRKCAYSLARIGTDDSRKALERLSQNSDPYISEYAREGLAKWPLKT